MTPRIIQGHVHTLVVEPCDDPQARQLGAVRVRWATAGEMLDAVTAEWPVTGGEMENDR